MGNRVSQDALKYILDVQAGLTQVIGDSDGNRYIHSPRGIHAQYDGSDWQYALTDALGSVRSYIGADASVLSSVNYSPVGVPDTTWEGWAFTGEQRDSTGIQYHRARYMSPALGGFLSLDPFEGVHNRPMSLNGYSWVEGNPVMNVDPSGEQCIEPFCCDNLRKSSLSRDIIDAMCPPTSTPSPTTTVSCSLTQYVERIAAFARQEANQEQGQLIPSAAAIALAEINVINAGNSPRSRSTTYPKRTTWVNEEDSSTILSLATAFVGGSCSKNLANIVSQQIDNISELSEYGATLAYIAQNPTIMYEHSFKSDNIVEGLNGIITNPSQTGINSGEDFPVNARDSQGNILEPFKGVVIRGNTVSVVVSNDFNPLPLEWNCSIGKNAVVSANYDPNTDGGQNFAAGLSCKSCKRSTRKWWWTRDYTTFEKLSEADFQERFRTTKIGGWIASCDE